MEYEDEQNLFQSMHAWLENVWSEMEHVNENNEWFWVFNVNVKFFDDKPLVSLVAGNILFYAM